MTTGSRLGRWLAGSTAMLLGLVVWAPALAAQPTNPFPGTGTPFELTWGANDGAACTALGGPTDNGYENESILTSLCIAARFEYYSNGWARLSIWNRSGAEGTASDAELRAFGIFWCQGAGDFACPTGNEPNSGDPTPRVYNDGTTDGNWFGATCSGGNDVDWRVLDPTGTMLNTTTFPCTASTGGTGATRGDGFDDPDFNVLSSSTPFTSLYGAGGYTWEFFLGTGPNYDFTTQWLVLDARFVDVGPDDLQRDWSCIDDRYVGTATGGVLNQSGIDENIGCGGLSTVPEPGTLALLSTGLVGLALAGFRRRKR